MESFRVHQTGERTLRYAFPPKIDPEIHRQVIRLQTLALTCPEVLEAVPGYHTLTLYITHERYISSVQNQILLGWNKTLNHIDYESRLHLIPVCYNGEDLEQLAYAKNLTVQQVIEIHTSVQYTIYMIGFLPGFPYLGGLDERLHLPRREVPRKSVPKGSVGIGGSQTGIYPIESPGGWHLIGQTPIDIFSATSLDTPFLFQAGNRIQFTEITQDEYQNYSGGGVIDEAN